MSISGQTQASNLVHHFGFGRVPKANTSRKIYACFCYSIRLQFIESDDTKKVPVACDFTGDTDTRNKSDIRIRSDGQ
jgi:hypothetical protein